MATFVWNGGSGNFTDSNWTENGSSTLGIPGPGDAAVVTSGGNVVINTGVDVNLISAGVGATIELYGRTSYFYTSAYGVINGATLTGGGTFEVVESITTSSHHGGKSGLNGVTLDAGTTFIVPDANYGGLYTRLQGIITNNGTMVLDGVNHDTRFQTENSVTIAGSGTLLLNNNANDRLTGDTNSATRLLTIGADQHVVGGGYVGGGDLSITNLGTIAATETGSGGVPLTLGIAGNSPVGWVNENLIVADGGTLVVTQGNGGSLTQAGNGIIEAVSGGVVKLTGGITVSGGQLATDGAPGSQIDAGANTKLDGVTLTAGSRLTIPDNNYALLNGVVTNNGTIALDSTGNPTSLRANGTLTGNGIVLLNNNANDALVRNTNYGPALTIDAGQTIEGGGYIGGGDLSITNFGTIAATETGSGGVPLTLGVAGNSPASWVNENLIVANGGTLVITQGNGGSLTQTGNGIIEAVSGGVVALTGGITVSGGPLATDGAPGSQIDAGANTKLDGVTLTIGSRLIIPDNNYALLNGVITNNGTIALDSTSNPTSLRAQGTLTGNGIVLLNNNANDALVRNTNYGPALTIDVNQTIEGGGYIGGGDLSITNFGTIAAIETGSGGVPLTLGVAGNSPASWTNENLIVANGGTLVVTQGNGGSLTQTGNGIIEAVSGGVVALTGGITVSGGQLATAGAPGSQIDADAHTTLDGITLASGSRLVIPDNNYAFIGGVITNDGTMTLNSIGNDTTLRIEGPTTLTGSGTVLLNNSNGDRFIAANRADTLTVGAGQTIAGGGQFGAGDLGIVNLGTIAATETGSGGVALTVYPNGSGAVNVSGGVMEAVSGATLVLTGGAFTNSGTVAAFDSGAVAYTPSATNVNNTGGTLSGGIWEAVTDDSGTTSATVSLTGGAITTDAATIILSGAGSVVEAGDGNSFTGIDASLTTIATTGILEILDGRNFVAANGMSIAAGGALDIDTIGAGGSSVTIGGTLTNDGSIVVGSIGEAAPSSWQALGQVSGTGVIDLAGSGTLAAFDGAVSAGQSVSMTQSTETVALADPQAFAGTIAGLLGGNSVSVPTNDIDLTAIANSTISSASLNTSTDQLSVVLNGGTSVAIQLSGSYTSGTLVDHITDGSGNGTDLFLSPCFCRGTLIRTEAGEVPVEELAIGDRLVTAAGAAKPIRWIGHRAYDGRFVTGNRAVLPIRIAAGALAEGVPARDLWVSPEHALFIDSVLVPAGHLVNGATIVRAEQVERLEYFNIEFDEHEIMIAEGAPAESYVDCDNRLMFANGADYPLLYPRDERPRWQFCAPRLDWDMAELTAIRAALLERAEALGHALALDHDLHLIVDGEIVRPDTVAGGIHRFHLPAERGAVWLASRSAVPAEIDAASRDLRRLGVAIERIVLCDADLSIEAWHGHVALRGGFHDDEVTHRWTDGLARLPELLLRPFAGALTLEVRLVPNSLAYRLAAPAGAAAVA